MTAQLEAYDPQAVHFGSDNSGRTECHRSVNGATILVTQIANVTCRQCAELHNEQRAAELLAGSAHIRYAADLRPLCGGWGNFGPEPVIGMADANCQECLDACGKVDDSACDCPPRSVTCTHSIRRYPNTEDGRARYTQDTDGGF